MKLLFGCFSLALLAGCQSPKYTAFAPLDARLEPDPDGGVRHFVVDNISGQELHNYSFSAYLWDEHDPNFIRGGPTYSYKASGSKLAPGRAVRFRQWGTQIEHKIINPITRVEIVGHCDEGFFRQGWRNTKSDQLRPVGTVPIGEHK